MSGYAGWDGGYGNGYGGWYAPPPPPPKPGAIPLRPLAVGDILSGAFSVIGRYGRQIYGFTFAILGITFLALGIAVGLAYLLVHSAVHAAFDSSPTGGQVAQLVVAGVTVGLVAVLTGLYGMAALQAGYAVATSHAVLGKPLTLGELWRQAHPRVLSVLGVQVLTGLLVGVPVILGYALLIGAVVAGVTAGSGAGVALALLGILLFLGGGACAAFFYIRFGMAPTAAALEGQPPVAALRRSWQLVQGSWWRVLGIMLLVVILVGVVNQIIQTVLMLIGGFSVSAATFSGGAPEPATFIILLLVILFALAVSSALTTPFPYLVATLLYTDLRIRQERFDLTLAEAAASAAASPR
ncbi:hypothetical protein [Streptomyces gobiensis]|uniref:hypothetical protein n=1 Tax=Streptomyces gobiensis TaxID=2875706 RepID=UPI001E5DB938|nr:hypothetical protein [Streptomyces gobiensis]UGY93135.1 hypothetical protein test1122_16400 [Streptomyces gobiensis]